MIPVPETALRVGFWERRTGWTLLKQVLFLEPLPGGARWAAAFGSLLLFAFGLQVVTGVLLMMNYAPSVESAWPSVKFIQDEVPLGGYIRAVHHWGSSAMVILLLVHLIQVFVWGAYKKPREFTRMVGVLLLACILGLSFTGYLLPWDQKAYWATKVGLGIASTTPGIGDGVKAVLQGGPQMGGLTLTRFFTIHAFILPGLVIFLAVVHLYLFRLHGVTGSANYLGGMVNGSGLPSLTAGWSIEIGHEERHVVHIQKERPQILAALRPHTYRVFVDDQFVQEHVG